MSMENGDGLVTFEAALAAVLQQLTMQCRYADAANANMAEVVVMARQFGASWEAIGAACGMSRQGAHKRWASVDPGRRGASPP